MSEINPPTRESKKEQPMKFVMVFAAPARSKYNTLMKYRNIVTITTINAVVSNEVNPKNQRSVHINYHHSNRPTSRTCIIFLTS